MSNDLVKLYKELGNEKQTTEITKVRKNIHNKLNDKLREHFLELLEIGEVVGYEKLEKELASAAELIGKLEKKK
jgi:hypothetical protein